MRVRLAVLTTTMACVFGALIPTSALAAPVSTASHASAADAAYSSQLMTPMSQLVKAAQLTVAGFSAIQNNDLSTAVSRFKAALTLYKKARARVYALQPPASMAQTNTYLKTSVDDYVRAVTLYRDGTSTMSVSMIKQGIAYYKRANNELKQAETALAAHL